MSEIYKIIFVGLDFAGKTSILKILEGSFSELDQIKPTLGSKRTEWNILGFPIVNWDLGGQKQYRAEYLSNKEQVLRETNLLIFVVDLQDAERFKEASIYFNNILQALEDLEVRCPVLLCLHKADPDIADKPEIKKNLKTVTDLFSKYKRRYKVEFEVKVFVTSIFNQKSLIEMFSEGIQEMIPIGILSQLLDEFLAEVKDVGVIGAILLDYNYFMIGDAFPNTTTKSTCYRTINAFITLLRDFQGVYEEKRQLNFDLPLPNDNLYMFSFQKFTDLKSPYYLLLMGSSALKADAAFTLFKQKYLPRMDQSLKNLIKGIG